MAVVVFTQPFYIFYLFLFDFVKTSFDKFHYSRTEFFEYILFLFFFAVADIMPALQQYYENLKIKIADNKHTFNNYKERLTLVRMEKVSKYMNLGFDDVDPAILGEENVNILREFDLFSDAGSQASGKSTRTSG